MVWLFAVGLGADTLLWFSEDGAVLLALSGLSVILTPEPALLLSFFLCAITVRFCTFPWDSEELHALDKNCPGCLVNLVTSWKQNSFVILICSWSKQLTGAIFARWYQEMQDPEKQIHARFYKEFKILRLSLNVNFIYVQILLWQWLHFLLLNNFLKFYFAAYPLIFELSVKF